MKSETIKVKRWQICFMPKDLQKLPSYKTIQDGIEWCGHGASFERGVRMFESLANIDSQLRDMEKRLADP